MHAIPNEVAVFCVNIIDASAQTLEVVVVNVCDNAHSSSRNSATSAGRVQRSGGTNCVGLERSARRCELLKFAPSRKLSGL